MIEPTQLKAAILAVRKELGIGEEHKFTACAPKTEDLRILLDAFDKMAPDLEDVVLRYIDLLKATGDLDFWVGNLLATRRPASKGRAFVGEESLKKLSEAYDKSHAEVTKPLSATA